MRDTKKKIGKKIFRFKKINKLASNYFFQESYIFSFIHQKIFYGNQIFIFPDKIYEIRKKCLK